MGEALQESKDVGDDPAVMCSTLRAPSILSWRRKRFNTGVTDEAGHQNALVQGICSLFQMGADIEKTETEAAIFFPVGAGCYGEAYLLLCISAEVSRTNHICGISEP